jgi:hypothetical protein
MVICFSNWRYNLSDVVLTASLASAFGEANLARSKYRHSQKHASSQ